MLSLWSLYTWQTVPTSSAIIRFMGHWTGTGLCLYRISLAPISHHLLRDRSILIRVWRKISVFCKYLLSVAQPGANSPHYVNDYPSSLGFNLLSWAIIAIRGECQLKRRALNRSITNSGQTTKSWGLIFLCWVVKAELMMWSSSTVPESCILASIYQLTQPHISHLTGNSRLKE